MKTIDHTPQQKLQDLLVSILAGCQCIQQIETRLRPEQALARAWQRQRFASQSSIAETLNAFTPETVGQLRGALTQLYRCYGQALHHEFATDWLWLDVDLTGLLASRHAEGSEKGYFAGKKPTGAPGQSGIDSGLPRESPLAGVPGEYRESGLLEAHAHDVGSRVAVDA